MNSASMIKAVVGIDVSKKKLDVALLVNGKVKNKVVENSRKGYTALVGWLRKHNVVLEEVHICMESTGAYSEPVALWLQDQGLQVSMVNPALVKGFGQSENIRNKNDKADAGLIARYCATMHPPLWKAPSPEVRKLRAMVDHVAALKDIRQQEENRIEAHQAAGQAEMVVAVRKHVDWLNKELKQLEKDIDDHVDGHPNLKHDVDLLDSIPAIARLTAVKIIARVGDIRRFSCAKELAAYLGVTPRQRQSGSSVRGRSTMSRMGSKEARTALYMPAVTAMTRNPILAAFAQRLLANGKAPMAVIGAVMRKLVHQMYGVICSGKPFDPAHLNKTLAV